MSCHGFSLEALATRAAADVDDFYATRPHQPADPGDILVLSSDGKGIVMRPDALRPATKAAAKASSSKLATRLSKGEKRNRKRMATVGAVYALAPVPRTATDVLTTSDTPTPAPKASNKWLTASVAQDTTAVPAAAPGRRQRPAPRWCPGPRWRSTTCLRPSGRVWVCPRWSARRWRCGVPG